MIAAQPAAAPVVRVSGFDLVKINETVDHVAPGGSHPLCQAIPVTTIRARVTWRALHSMATLRARLTTPTGREGHEHTLHAHPAQGHGTIAFTPRGERLAGDAFGEGRYTVTVRRAGRVVAHATLRFTAPSSPC